MSERARYLHRRMERNRLHREAQRCLRQLEAMWWPRWILGPEEPA